jgi:hypothetical protein
VRIKRPAEVAAPDIHHTNGYLLPVPWVDHRSGRGRAEAAETYQCEERSRLV